MISGDEVPVQLAVPAIGVDAPVILLGLNPDDSLEVPSTAQDTGWWSGGSVPGTPGPAVIAGHINLDGEPGVFAELGRLDPGDDVRVRLDAGQEVSYRVDRVERYAKEASPRTTCTGRQTSPSCASSPAAGPSTRPPATTGTTSSPSPPWWPDRWWTLRLAHELGEQGPQARSLFERLTQLCEVVGTGQHRMTSECTARRVRAETDHQVALVAVALELEQLQRGLGVLPGGGGLLDDLAVTPWVLERPGHPSGHAGSVRDRLLRWGFHGSPHRRQPSQLG